MITFNTSNSTWQSEGDAQTQSGAVDVTAGRVSTFDFSGTVLGVSSDPNGGHVTINPNGTVALVMTNPNQSGQTSFDVQ
ncbi:hypothetical protein, partial [Roseobacter sp.]|uniref:hypothetical protein n=1 Tax=Roseobacter sp. TaxID=1907202 RepID=UPI00385F0BB5